MVFCSYKLTSKVLEVFRKASIIPLSKSNLAKTIEVLNFQIEKLY